MTPERRLTLLRLLALLLVVGILAIVVIFRDQVQNLAAYGYPGIFLVAAIANATVFVPVPGVMVVFAMGAVFNPFLTALFAGLGAATGELSGYLLGFSGQGLVEGSQRYERIFQWIKNHPRFRDLAVVVMAAIPNPFFDLAGIAAGTLKIPVLRFYFFCAIGSILKMLVFAYGGDTILNWLFER